MFTGEEDQFEPENQRGVPKSSGSDHVIILKSRYPLDNIFACCRLPPLRPPPSACGNQWNAPQHPSLSIPSAR